MTISVTWPQVLAWRLKRQFVDPAAGADAVSVVRRLTGVQAQVASSAELAVAVRQARPRRGEIGRALWQERTLAKTWTARGTLHLVPADELPSYAAVLGSFRHWEKGSWQRGHGVTAAEVEAILDAVPRALAGRTLTREELVEAVIEVTGDEHLREALTSGWGALLKPLSFLGELCYGPPREGRVTFAAPRDRVPGWPAALPTAEEGGLVLVRSFLGAHGPGAPETFDAWLYRGAARKATLRGWFRDLAPELAEVEVEGRPMVVLAEHLDDLAATEPAGGVHLLPGFDQYILGAPRDLEPLLPKEARAKVSRAAGWISPVVVHRGRVAGVWEAGNGEIAFDLFEDVPPAPLRAEAERVTALLGSRGAAE
ncbi:winged helix DNA-binding domain-containing protein [Planobispora rosea]|uniref:winged helix DNA-binding domain-containing protein n=1 Tax=Planobispora rosea TaxID=35762 RepID=UPI00083ADC7C|nr:winged helix DNA-binding domain-containing protein [Planobispora rosea]